MVHPTYLLNGFGGKTLKNWIGFFVLVILLGILGWLGRSYLPIPGLSPAPAPAPAPTAVRGKITQSTPPTPIQASAPTTGTIESGQSTQTTVIQNNQTIVAETQTPTASTAPNQNVVALNAPEPSPQTSGSVPIPEPESIAESQPNPEAAPGVATDPAQPVELTPPPSMRPEADNMKAPPIAATTTVTESQPETRPDSPESASATPAMATAPSTPVQAPPEPVSAVPAPTPAPPVSATPAPPESTTPAPFNIQVGAYLTKTYADAKLESLTRLGYDAFIYKVTDAKQRTWHAVRFGRFQTREEAIRMLTDFKANENMDAIISRSDSL